MEWLVNTILNCFPETNAPLSPAQTGYRQQRNTEDQLAYIIQDIENTFKEKKEVLAVFDISHTFDTVWKEGLMLNILRTGVTHNM